MLHTEEEKKEAKDAVRQLNVFPTNQEAKKNPDAVYSDHAMIFTTVPLGGEKKDEIRIISLNTLNSSKHSGFNKEPGDDEIKEIGNTQEAKDYIEQLNLQRKNKKEKRYQRIISGLAAAVQEQKADIIFLQETDEDLAEKLLNEKLNLRQEENISGGFALPVDFLSSGWKIRKANNMLIAYNADRFDEVKEVKTEPHVEAKDHQQIVTAGHLLSLSLREKISQRTIDFHNVWGDYNQKHDQREQEYGALLSQNQDRTVVLLGDTNSRVAPLDEITRNITTGIVPTGTAEFHYDLKSDKQLSDFPDGGFFRAPGGEITQMTTKVLDFSTGKISEDNRTKDEVIPLTEGKKENPHERRVRVLALDKQYTQEKKELAEILEFDESFQYQIWSTSFNEKTVDLIFKNTEELNHFLRKFNYQEVKPPQKEMSHIPREAFLSQLQFYRAYNALKEATKITDTPLKTAGREVLNAAKNIKEKGVTKEELTKLTQFVMGTTAVVKEPTEANMQAHAKNIEEVNKMRRSKWKILGGAMLAVLGVALIAVAVSSVVMSFGATTPVAAPLIAIGATTIKAAGVTMGIFAATTALSGTVGVAATGYGLFSENRGVKAGLKGDLAVAGKQVLEKAEKAKKLKR